MSLRLKQRIARTLAGEPDFEFVVNTIEGMRSGLDNTEIIAYDWTIEAGFIIIAPAEEWADNIEDPYGVGPAMVVKLIDVDQEYQTGNFMLGTRLFEEGKGQAATQGRRLIHDIKRTPAANAWIRSLPPPQYGLAWKDGRTTMEIVQL